MNGVLLVDKPAGVTSHDVVVAVRRRFPAVRTGHAGTLDPFATGLLVVLMGRATRLQRFFLELPKKYRVTARLGWRSSTGDPEGELTPGRQPPEPLVLPTGVLSQTPPAFSAVHVQGERAYRRARRGEHVTLAPRQVTVERFALLWREGDRAGFEIVCSSGTYVRSLIADLGDAYCESLRRLAIGPFDVQDAVAAEAPGHPGDRRRRTELAGDPQPLPLSRALDFLPWVRLDEPAARRAGHGAAVPAPERLAEGPVVLAGVGGPVAVAQWRDGPHGPELKPVVGLAG